MATKKAIILARVSTSAQDYSAQTEQLKKYANKKGYEDLEIIETTESGFKDIKSKKGFSILTDFIENNEEYKTVFVTEISRLARRQSVLQAIKEYFVKEKIQLFILDKDYMLLDSQNRLNEQTDILFSLYGYFAESEMRQKLDRFARRKEKLKLEGIFTGGIRLFGYDIKLNESNSKKYVINKAEAKEIQCIFDWYLNGIDLEAKNVSIKQITLECIARNFSHYTHSKRNINKLLKEEGYTGYKVTNNKRLNKDWEEDNTLPKYVKCSSEMTYPVIIERDVFDKVKSKMLSKNMQADKSTKHITILSKLIQCPLCKANYRSEYRTKNGYDKHFYSCTNAKSIKKCSNKKSISMRLIDSAVWSFIKNDLHDISEKVIRKNNLDVKSIQSNIDSLNCKIKEYEEQISIENQIFRNSMKLKNIDSQKAIDEYNERTSKLDKEISTINAKIKNLEFKLNNTKIFGNEKLEKTINDNISLIEKNKSEIKKYINQIVRRITILHSDSNYVVAKIETFDNTYSLDFDNDDIKERFWFTYLLIDKRDTNRIKLKMINNEMVNFENGFFSLREMKYSIDEIFEAENLDISKFAEYCGIVSDCIIAIRSNYIFASVYSIPFIRLDVYKEDSLDN